MHALGQLCFFSSVQKVNIGTLFPAQSDCVWLFLWRQDGSLSFCTEAGQRARSAALETSARPQVRRNLLHVRHHASMYSKKNANRERHAGMLTWLEVVSGTC